MDRAPSSFAHLVPGCMAPLSPAALQPAKEEGVRSPLPLQNVSNTHGVDSLTRHMAKQPRFTPGSPSSPYTSQFAPRPQPSPLSRLASTSVPMSRIGSSDTEPDSAYALSQDLRSRTESLDGASAFAPAPLFSYRTMSESDATMMEADEGHDDELNHVLVQAAASARDSGLLSATPGTAALRALGHTQSPFMAAVGLCAAADGYGRIAPAGFGRPDSGEMEHAAYLAAASGLLSPDADIGSESPFAAAAAATAAAQLHGGPGTEGMLPSRMVSHPHHSRTGRMGRAVSVMSDFAPTLGSHMASSDALLTESQPALVLPSMAHGPAYQPPAYQPPTPRATTPSMALSRRTSRRSLVEAFDDGTGDANAHSWPREGLRDNLRKDRSRQARASPLPYHVPAHAAARRNAAAATAAGEASRNMRRLSSMSALAGQLEGLQPCPIGADHASAYLPSVQLPNFSVEDMDDSPLSAVLPCESLDVFSPAEVYAMPDSRDPILPAHPHDQASAATAHAAAQAVHLRMYAQSCAPVMMSRVSAPANMGPNSVFATAAAAAPMAVLPPAVLSPMQARRHVSFAHAPGPARASARTTAPTAAASNAAAASMESPMAFSRMLSMPALPQPATVSERHEHILPTVTSEFDGFKDLRLLSPETVAAVMNGAYEDMYDRVVIVDCRFPYEFHGGHIRGAINLWTMEKTMSSFFAQPLVDLDCGRRVCIIFHCEFSSARGPAQYRYLREIDTTIMLQQARIFPETYVMAGGYCAFFKEHGHLCTPNTYQIMKDNEFKRECASNQIILDCSKNEAQQNKWKQDGIVLRIIDAVHTQGREGLRQFRAVPASPPPTALASVSPYTPRHGQRLPGN